MASENQTQTTALINYHRAVADKAIGTMKDALERKSSSSVVFTLRDFRDHSKNLREELAAMMAELDAADAWVEREFQRIRQKSDKYGNKVSNA